MLLGQVRLALDDGGHLVLGTIEQLLFIVDHVIRHDTGRQIFHGAAKDRLILEPQLGDDVELQLVRRARFRIRVWREKAPLIP